MIQKLNVELTGVSLLQLGTEKLFAYAELMKSEFNTISEIFPIFICLTSFSRFAVMISKLIRNSLFKIEGHVSGIGLLLNFNEALKTHPYCMDHTTSIDAKNDTDFFYLIHKFTV